MSKATGPSLLGALESRSLWSFARNVLSLTSVQFVSYLVPLITLPYLTRVLGAEAWGKLAYYQAISVIFALLANWGFPVYATSMAAAAREDKRQLSHYLSNVIFAQILLLALLALAAGGLAFWPTSVAGDATFLASVWFLTASLVIFPSWMYQALELFRFLTLSKIVARLLPVPLIFLLVHSPEAASRVIFLNAGAAFLVGLFSLWWLWRRYEISVLEFRLPSALRLLLQSSLMFSAQLATSAYTSLVPIVLGSIVSSNEFALFALADRVRQLAANIFLPVSQSLLPRVSYLLACDRAVGVHFLKVAGTVSIALMTAISAGVFWGAPQILTLLGGDEFVDGAATLRLLAFVPAIVAVSNIIGIQYLVPIGHQKTLSAVLVGVAFLSLLAMYPTIHRGGAEGAALLILCSECLITFLLTIIMTSRHARIGASR